MSSSRKFAGRLFQTRGPATAKLLSPNVLCVRGAAHDLSVDERSRRRGPSETKCMSSARYEGAWPDNDEKTKQTLSIEVYRTWGVRGSVGHGTNCTERRSCEVQTPSNGIKGSLKDCG